MSKADFTEKKDLKTAKMAKIESFMDKFFDKKFGEKSDD